MNVSIVFFFCTDNLLRRLKTLKITLSKRERERVSESEWVRERERF